ncbi:MAG: type I DNA topoisomerase [Candidatus Eisenbacteria bacterium]|nr:type I DNA topoisomerase [Candidatus Latescibacterota bacterium]MBD3301196.1 type I DNA topoisomerase [Candidatus Eisenbacteria bacterium]
MDARLKLIIVESPAKAKTIEKFLGRDYKVAASYGHIRDLPSTASEIPEKVRSEPWARLGVNTEEGFEPTYVVPRDSKKAIAELRKLVKDAEKLLLATDEDREGESISWHLLEVLKPTIPVGRITFHEITRSAILEALENPREIDMKLVRAQESRRILDRLYGYTLSPVLWKKVRTKLSAGRVQSVAVRLIVEREEERLAFRTAVYWDVEAKLGAKELEFPASLIEIDGRKLASGKDFDSTTGERKSRSDALLLDEETARRIARDCPEQVPWKVVRVEQKEVRQRPSPPFTTSTLQQAAGSRLNMSPRQTMMVAQRLYEGIELGDGEREGLITYMRTDSLTVSEKALRETGAWIREELGDEFHDEPRRYKTKSKGAQEAHEAIRPTDVRRTPERMARLLKKDELALYRLIWNRMVASQMTDARLDKVSVDLEATIDGTPHLFRANGSTVRFPGFLKIYGNGGKDSILPPFAEGQTVGGPSDPVRVLGAEPLRHETNPPPRYTEASLVKKLEEEGIGRPSTYAPTISTIQQRQYVVKKGSALIPTFVGMAVVHLLRRHFEHYVDVAFTAKMEESLDEIASGEVDMVEFLENFYRGSGNGSRGLVEKIEAELPNIDFPAIEIGDAPQEGWPVTVRIGRNTVYLQCGEGDEAQTAPIPVDLLIDELTLAKALELLEARSKANEPIGQHPETGENIYVLIGPYGPYVQLGETDGEKKPKRVSLKRGTTREDVSLDYALKLLSLPRVIGEDPESGKPVRASIGPFGPYVERDKNYRSLGDIDQVFSVSLEEALALLAQPRRSRRRVVKALGSHPETGKEIEVCEGRYGPYVTDGKLNASLPRDTDPAQIEMGTAVSLLEEAAERKKTKTTRKKTSKRTTKRTTKRKTKRAPRKKSETTAKTTKRTTRKKSPARKKTARKSTRKTARRRTA